MGAAAAQEEANKQRSINYNHGFDLILFVHIYINVAVIGETKTWCTTYKQTPQVQPNVHLHIPTQDE